MGTIDVVVQHLTTNGLSPNVPHLQCHVHTTWRSHDQLTSGYTYTHTLLFLYPVARWLL